MALNSLARYVCGPLGLLFSSAFADSTTDLAPNVTSLSHRMYELHLIIFGLCVVIGIVVFTIMFYSLAKYRKSRDTESTQFCTNTKLEVIWSIIPFLIVVAMVVPATIVVIRMSSNVHTNTPVNNPNDQKQLTNQQTQYKLHLRTTMHHGNN